MCYNCSSLINLVFSNFNTENVINMGRVFKNCSSLINLDLSNFNTRNNHNVSYIFAGCSKLKIIITNDFKILKLFEGISKC